MAQELGIFYPDNNPVEIPDGIDINNIQMDEMIDAKAGPFLAKDMEGGGRGSNAWAIAPERTETGRPFLCNDTHLLLSIPGIWYMNHLNSQEGYHCTGSTIAGLPGILIGHNEQIAWGITLAYTDVEDIFIEKQDVTEPGRYEYRGELKEYDKIKEIIIDKLGIEEEKITMDAKFIEDLGADSLDTVELIMQFEEEFSIEIPDNDAESLLSVKQAVDYISNKLI